MELSHAYTKRDLQTARSLLRRAQRERLTVDELIALIDARLDQEIAVRPAEVTEVVCPSCNRFALVRPDGVSEPVLACPSCRYSVYEGVR